MSLGAPNGTVSLLRYSYPAATPQLVSTLAITKKPTNFSKRIANTRVHKYLQFWRVASAGSNVLSNLNLAEVVAIQACTNSAFPVNTP